MGWNPVNLKRKTNKRFSRIWRFGCTYIIKNSSDLFWVCLELTFDCHHGDIDCYKCSVHKPQATPWPFAAKNYTTQYTIYRIESNLWTVLVRIDKKERIIIFMEKWVFLHRFCIGFTQLSQITRCTYISAGYPRFERALRNSMQCNITNKV